ncbi:MAG: chromate transporter [Acidobacteriota bacterium]|nr:MAG: chromate transporter [Acidobacteriota bacterium]
MIDRSYLSDLRYIIIKNLLQAGEWISEQFTPVNAKVDWRALAKTFLKLGATGFGGGVAVIAQIRNLVVRQNRWLSEEEFLDAVSLAQSLPGANAANAITYVGLKLAGIRGAIISVASFIFPSFLMMIGVTVAHDYLKELPDAQRIFQGFNAAVVGLIAATTVKLGKTAVQQQWHLELGVVVAFMLIFTQMTVVEVVLIAGVTGIFIKSYKTRARQRVRTRIRKERQQKVREMKAETKARKSAAEMIEDPDRLASDYKMDVSLPPRKSIDRPAETDQPDDGTDGRQLHLPLIWKTRSTGKLRSFAPLAFLPFLPLLAWPIISKLVVVWKLIMIFMRIGTVTFGGGFVMIPQIEYDVVDVHRWMDHRTFADGMAFGQITPGPVLITATFVGYKVAGLIGAIAATIAAFLPSFIMTTIAGTSIDRFRTNFNVQAFLAGVAPAVVGMLAAAGVSLAKSGLGSVDGYAVATLAFLLMLRARFNPVLIIFGCGFLQWLISKGVIGWMPF